VSLPVLVLAVGGLHGGSSLSPSAGLLLGLLLILLNGFFVAAEFALVKVRPTQLAPHVIKGHRRAKVAYHMVSHLDAYLSATQLGITLASIALGWVGEPAFAWILRPVIQLVPGATEEVVHSVSLFAAFALISVLHIVLGELAPKSLAIRKPEGTTLWVALPLFAFYYVTYPAIWLLNHSANLLLRTAGIASVTEAELAHDEEELRRLLASTHASQLPADKRELLDNIFELSHRFARQIMVPRADVVYLSKERPVDENLSAARVSGHTRFPLCEGDLDHVVGLIHIKDLFHAERPPGALEEVARPITFVPESLPLDRLLRRMLSERTHMVAVLDEYGGVSGIVTLENVIEEIVGEIQDEFDREVPEIVRKGPNVYLVAGSTLVDDLEQVLGVEFSERDEDTVGGVVLSELGGRPQRGARVELGPLLIEVREVEHNRVQSVRVIVREPTPALRPE
jgi:CBS domain containing-hemolysin-like protein